MQQKINLVDKLQINIIISLNTSKSPTEVFLPKYHTGLGSTEALICSFETAGFSFEQTHLKCTIMMTKPESKLGKIFPKCILVLKPILFSDYDRGYKPLKAVNIAAFTACMR
jgi:hypothetical protein